MADRDRTLERYELVERIAGGGMGEVFRAIAYGAHGFSKSLAVKRILPRYAADPEFERRFIAEAKLAVSLTHANIIGVLDFGHMDGSLYLAMEYVDGLDLSALLDGFEAHGEKVPIGAALHVASEICKGLDFAHRQDVVHRDISPANVLLSRAGEVKIADFGIARAVSGVTSQIDSSRIVGKLRYMSPEQIQGKRADAQSDLFSLGIVLWEVLTCEQLITARDLDTARQQVCVMPIPRVSTRRPDVPAALDDIVATMLERDRDRRSPTARALLRRLAKCAYAVDPVPTAIDVSDAVERAMAGLELETDDGGLDDAILAELGGVERPASRITRARDASASTITIFRGAADDRGVSQWSTSLGDAGKVGKATKRLHAIPEPPVSRGTAEKPVTIDVASGARTTADTDVIGRARPRWLIPLGATLAVASLGTALALGLGRGEGQKADPPDAAIATATGAPDGAPVLAARVDAGGAMDAAPTRIALRVESRPAGASILIGEDDLGLTPTSIELPPGPHVITLRKSGHRDATIKTTLEAGATPPPVSARLSAEMGTIAIFSHPWANVYYRGRKVGQTPIGKLRLPVGSHRLTLKNPVSGKVKRVRVKVPHRAPYRFNL